MIKHQLLFLFPLLLITAVFGQDIQLDNALKKTSNVIYIGIENRLLIRTKGIAVNSVRSESATVRILADTILVLPRAVGPVEIELYTNSKSYSVAYEARFLPLPRLSFTDGTKEMLSLTKEELRNAKLHLIGVDSEGGLFSNYLIKGFVIAIAGKKYDISGDSLPNTVIDVLESLGSGESFTVEEVSFKNKESGSTLGVGSSYRFTIH